MARLDGGGYGWCAGDAEKDAIPPTFYLQASTLEMRVCRIHFLEMLIGKIIQRKM